MGAPYKNRLWLQGQVVSSPTRAWVSARTRVTTFRLAMVESWLNDNGELRERKNYATVEVIGRDAERAGETIKLGSWVTLEGYLRSEQVKGQEVIKVRTFTIDVWESDDAKDPKKETGRDHDGRVPRAEVSRGE